MRKVRVAMSRALACRVSLNVASKETENPYMGEEYMLLPENITFT